jgi:hypothetical protein
VSPSANRGGGVGNSGVAPSAQRVEDNVVVIGSVPCRLALEVHVNGQWVNGAGEAHASKEEIGAHRYQSSCSSSAAKCTRVVTAEGCDVVSPGYSRCRRRVRNGVVNYLEKR